MLKLEYFDYNHSVLRVYRDESGKVWYLKDDILRLLNLDNCYNIPEENLLLITITNDYLTTIPNLSDSPKTLSSSLTKLLFIDNIGLEILLNFTDSKELKTSLVEWIKSEIIGDTEISDKLSVSFEVSDKGIFESTIKLSDKEYLEYWFYEELKFRLCNKYKGEEKDRIKLGIKLVLDCIKDNDMELKTSSGVRLDRVSGKDFDIHEFSKDIKFRIENFFKDMK